MSYRWIPIIATLAVILSILRQRGSYTVIDKITVNLNIKRDYYEAEFSNLGLKDIPIDEEYPAKFDRLLCGGIWCIVQLDYEYMEEDRNGTPIRIRKLTPIQMPHVDIAELKQGRKAFTQDEWMNMLTAARGSPGKCSQRIFLPSFKSFSNSCYLASVLLLSFLIN